MDIDFIAYSEDCVISGRLTLGADRLTDLMTQASEYVVDDAAFEALDDRHVVSLAQLAVGRDELCLGVASGPRGDRGRRVRTRPVSVRVRVGPYELLGYAHAMPSSDALASIQRRTIVPLTECRVRFMRGGKAVEHWHDTVLVNREKIDRIEIASEELPAALPDRPIAVDPRAHDLTGELLSDGLMKSEAARPGLVRLTGARRHQRLDLRFDQHRGRECLREAFPMR